MSPDSPRVMVSADGYRVEAILCSDLYVDQRGRICG